MKTKKQEEATSSQATATATKPTLAESQRKGAESRAAEAALHAKRLVTATPADHQYKELITLAEQDATRFAQEAITAPGTADAQYASRKAIEADAAAAWLFSQR